LSPERADALQSAIEAGAILLAVHTIDTQVEVVRSALRAAGATDVDTANWIE
jgi:ribosomal protein L16/L10AE